MKPFDLEKAKAGAPVIPRNLGSNRRKTYTVRDP